MSAALDRAHATQISPERLREVLAYDPDTGNFVWRERTSRRVWIGDHAGTVRAGKYTRIHIDLRGYYAHRLVWLYVHGKWPTDEIDHINGDKTDNRLANLREASRTQNVRNVVLRKTVMKGTSIHKKTGLWRARIRDNYKDISLGYFSTQEAAYRAYCDAATRLHGEFARLA